MYNSLSELINIKMNTKNLDIEIQEYIGMILEEACKEKKINLDNEEFNNLVNEFKNKSENLKLSNEEIKSYFFKKIQ